MNNDKISYFEVNITHDLSDKKNAEERKSAVDKDIFCRQQIIADLK